MSQQKNLNNFDKGKLLAFLRLRLDWTQEQLAERLSIDPLYLAQLERAQRKVEDWFPERATELERSFAEQEGN